MTCTSECLRPTASQAHCGSGCHRTFGSVRHAHLLRTPDGQLIAIVRTDRVTLCCPYHDRFPTISVSCREARTNRGVLGWAEVYEGGA